MSPRRRNPQDKLQPARGLCVALEHIWPSIVLDLHTTPKPPPWLPVREEKIEQRQIKRMLDAHLIPYYDTSQPFHAAITPGVPDLLCFNPLSNVDGPCWRIFFIEVKRRGEGQTPPQRLFEECCLRAGIDYILGSTTEVAAYLGLESAR